MEKDLLPPELWDIVFSRLTNMPDRRTFRSLSRMHCHVAHEVAIREIRQIAQEVKRANKRFSATGARVVYIASYRARMSCLVSKDDSDVTHCWMSDKGIATLLLGKCGASVAASTLDGTFGFALIPITFGHLSKEPFMLDARVDGCRYTHGIMSTGRTAYNGKFVPGHIAELSMAPQPKGRLLPKLVCTKCAKDYEHLCGEQRKRADGFYGLVERIESFLGYLEGDEGGQEYSLLKPLGTGNGMEQEKGLPGAPTEGM